MNPTRRARRGSPQPLWWVAVLLVVGGLLAGPAFAQVPVTEGAYGRFERALPLPVEVDESHARADYTHGVLCVRLPKHRRAAARRIQVRGA